MNEENQKETTVETKPKKKIGKAKKIIIAIIAVVLIAAIVIGILLLTGVIDLNLNKSSKIEAGVDQLIESYSKPIEELSNAAEENGVSPKVLNNINEDSKIGMTTEISANIEEFEVEGMSSSEKSAINSIKEILNDTTIGLDLRYDGDKKAYINAKGTIDDVEITGEAVYDGEKVGVRSPELNEKWLTVSGDDLEKIAEENGVDANQVKEQLELIINQSTQIAKSLEIDEKTREEIKERYENVLTDYIKEKSKDAESEKDEIKIDGKTKKCTKLTLDLKDKDIKNLLKSYLETFKDDKQTQDIIKKLFETMEEYYPQSETGTVDYNNIFDEMMSGIDTAIEEIDDLEFDGTAKLIIYGTATKTYRTDIEIEIDGQSVVLETTFNKDATVTEISVEDQKLATITVKSDKNTMNIKMELSKAAQTLLGGEFSIEINVKNENSKSEMSINVNAGNYGNVAMTVTTTVNKNEDNEYDSTTELKLDLDLPDYAVMKMSLNMKNNIKTGDISIPTISEQDAVSATDETELQTYITEMQDNLEKLQEDLMKIESLAPILESAIEDAF